MIALFAAKLVTLKGEKEQGKWYMWSVAFMGLTVGHFGK
jgi:hypothetical protein